MKQSKINLVKVTLYVLTLILSFLTLPVPSRCDTAAISVINPSTNEAHFVFYTNVTSVGHRFNVTLQIFNVTDLYTYDIKFVYDAELLNATNAWLPTWDSSWVFYGKESVKPTPFMYHGYVKIGDSLLGGAEGFNGDGLLAIVELEIIEPPGFPGEVSCILEIDNDDTYLLDSQGMDIPAAKNNGYYRFIWLEPGLRLVPYEYVAVNVAERFNITVALGNVTVSDRLVTVKFKLGFNSSLLDVYRVIEGDFLARFNNTPTPPYTNFSYTFHEDYLNVSVQLNPNATGQWNIFPKGNGNITTIEFESILQDPEKTLSCNLTLFDVEMLDDSQKTMPVSPPQNGSYSILPGNGSYLAIAINPQYATIGDNVTVNGYLKPPNPHVNVTIYIRQPYEAWAVLATVETDSNSQYNHTWAVHKPGQFEIKANWTGDDTFEPAESRIVTLTVNKMESSITLETETDEVTVGANVTFHGNLTPPTITNIAIHYHKLGKAWVVLDTVRTDINGYFTYIWKTSEGGAFEFYAFWEGTENISSAQSSKISITVRKLSSEITISLDTNTTDFDSAVTISGTLTPFKPYADIAIYYSKNWSEGSAVIWTKTDENSQYSYSWKPPELGTFEFYALWLGDETSQYAVSPTVVLTVEKSKSSISFTASPSNTTYMSNVTLIGTLSPIRENVSVTIYYRRFGEDSWSVLAVLFTNSTGCFTYPWAANQTGTFQFYSLWLGDPNTYPAESPIINVTVNKASVTITLQIAPITLTLNSTALIFGKVDPPLQTFSLTIQYRLKGENEWTTLETVETDINGSYWLSWAPEKAGVYEFKASWLGDKNILPAESQIATVTVESEAQDYTLITVAVAVAALCLAVILAFLYRRKRKVGERKV